MIAIVIRAIALCALLLSGCLFFDSPVSTRTVCFNLCDCLTVGGVAEDQCNEDCNADPDLPMLPQECLDCLGLSSCDEFDDLSTACDVECGAVPRPIPEDIE